MQVLDELPSSLCSFFTVLSCWQPLNSRQEFYIKGNVFSVISDTIGGFCRQAAKLGRLHCSISLPLLALESLLTQEGVGLHCAQWLHARLMFTFPQQHGCCHCPDLQWGLQQCYSIISSVNGTSLILSCASAHGEHN